MLIHARIADDDGQPRSDPQFPVVSPRGGAQLDQALLDNVLRGVVIPEVFTLSVPAMTRLRQPERQVLDTLVDAGWRSRSEALAWCVRPVVRRSADWLEELREATTSVQRVRGAAPQEPVPPPGCVLQPALYLDARRCRTQHRGGGLRRRREDQDEYVANDTAT